MTYIVYNIERYSSRARVNPPMWSHNVSTHVRPVARRGRWAGDPSPPNPMCMMPVCALANSTLTSSYARIERTTSCGWPTLCSRERPTRAAWLSAGRVSIGVPAQRASVPDVCALHSNESTMRSHCVARCRWRACSTVLSPIREEAPRALWCAVASRLRFASAEAGKRRIHLQPSGVKEL